MNEQGVQLIKAHVWALICDCGGKFLIMLSPELAAEIKSGKKSVNQLIDDEKEKEIEAWLAKHTAAGGKIKQGIGVVIDDENEADEMVKKGQARQKENLTDLAERSWRIN